MPDEGTISQLTSLVEEAQSLMIVLSADPSADELAAGMALYRTMVNAGKNARIVSPRVPNILAEIAPDAIAQTDHIAQELGNENLTISFDYSEDQVDKVSYHIGEETGKFHLTIRPKPGFAPLDSSTVDFSYTGASADAIFLVGVSSLESLEQLYFGYEDLYQNTPLVNISLLGSRQSGIQLKPDYHSSLSELVAITFARLGLAVDADTATSLLFGIEQFSHNLTAPETEPETFEVVAQLLRSGARRVVRPQMSQAAQVSTGGFSFSEALKNAAKRREVPVDLDDELSGELNLADEEGVRAYQETNQQGKSNSAVEASAANTNSESTSNSESTKKSSKKSATKRRRRRRSSKKSKQKASAN